MGTVGEDAVLETEDVVWLRVDVALAAQARRAAADQARRAGFGPRRISEVELAVTEAATNLQRHAVDGALLIRLLRTPDEAAVEFLTIDSGPGMTDVAGALVDGTSSRGTMGVGLGTINRLADHFTIHSLPGRGTALTARFWATRPQEGGQRHPEQMVAGVTRPLGGESACGDSWAAHTDHDTAPLPPPRPRAGRSFVPGTASSTFSATAVSSRGPALLVLMCDGLGHGPLAARAGDVARETFRRSRGRRPDDLVDELHTAMRGTRGAALGVARVELADRLVRFCGVGNISVFVVGDDRRRALSSAPGIVGHQLPTLRTFEEPLPPGGALVMHSDGLTPRWNMEDFSGLLGQSPVTIAAQILNQAAVRRDDAGIVVVKVPG